MPPGDTEMVQNDPKLILLLIKLEAYLSVPLHIQRARQNNAIQRTVQAVHTYTDLKTTGLSDQGPLVDLVSF